MVVLTAELPRALLSIRENDTHVTVRLHHRETDIKSHFLAGVGACNLILHIHVVVTKTGYPLTSIF